MTHTPKVREIEHFLRAWREKPLRGNDADHIYGIHAGDEHEAKITVTGLEALVNSHAALVEALQDVARDMRSGFIANPSKSATRNYEALLEKVSAALKQAKGDS